MINIWLDDVRPAPDGWLWAKNASECYEMLSRHVGEVGILSLDHDLGDFNQPTGYDLVNAICYDLESTDLLPRSIYLHTANPVGRDNMYSALTNFYRLALDFGTMHRHIDINRGPHLYSWEQSMEKARQLGYF
ncbi:cyclic-phosphate processing receiver domain-containing protein [Paenibacillus xylanexedens]|uniref:cyclic-phosphate processing receiver domain-containing protein n=1 Tax=Paenibacillus xylanexedens TaxID=528191 RepID=UPI000F52CC9C|nr:cyclic-phosphate processing receiver domain-containing protein [Paenibacillus xylanexedens]